MNDALSDLLPAAESQTARLLQSTDWSLTPLGALPGWPRSLKSYVAMVLAMPTPAIIFWGPEQRQLYNDGYAAIMGPRHPRYFGLPYGECWPDTYPLIYPWMRRVLDHGDPWQVEREHIPLTRYGFDEEAYFTFTFSPLRDDEGRIAGILQPVFEVTASVLSDRRTDTLRRLSPDDPSGRPALDGLLAALGANTADLPFVRLYLRRDDGMLSPAIGCGTLADGPAAAVDRAAQAWAEGTGPLPCTLDAESGWPAPANARAAALLPLATGPGSPPIGAVAFGVSARLHFDGRYQAFLSMAARSIAETLLRARAQQAVDQQRRMLHELFQQAPAGIAVTSGPQHVFELVNPGYQRFIGQRSVVGKSLRDALPEMVDQPFLGILDEVYRSGRPYVGISQSAQLARGPDGASEEAHFNFVYQPLNDGEQRTTGILVFAYEVTDQVIARRRAEALADELRDEHRRKDDFLAMLAHELRNPLAPISAAAELLRRHPGDELRVRRSSEIVSRQVRHMAELINDLLDASRVTRGLVEIERRTEDLKQIVAGAVEQVRPLVESRRHRLTVDLMAGPAPVSGDRKRLVQVVANLLDNAAKYTPEGGELSVTLAADGDELALRVADNGIGISPALQPRVFDLFVQGERAPDRGQGGLGIGLALARSLVRLHGGRLTLESAGTGRGSRFTLRLPRDTPVGTEAAPAASTPRDGERRSVLLVDDNVDAAQLLAMQLEYDGHEVSVAHEPMAAIELAKARPPEVCVLDIGLPGMDGHELARRLRALPGTRDALMIALTGYGQPSDRDRAMAAGFDHFLVKPADPAALAALLLLRHGAPAA